MDPHAFAGLGMSHSVLEVYFCVFLAMYTGQLYHFTTAIISQKSLKAQIVTLCGGIAFIIILERILNIQERRPTSSAARKWESPIDPMLNVLHS
jgi:hypothetical protein